MDSEALGKLDQMLAKDLFEIKVGTLIGGLRLYKDTTSFGRCASYNVGGWVVSKKARPIEVIRTPFYSVNTMEEANVFNAEKALELLSPSNDLSNYGLLWILIRTNLLEFTLASSPWNLRRLFIVEISS